VATSTYAFRVEGMHCGSCALLIDDTLDDLPGVHSTQTTMKAGRSSVELDVGQTSPQDVVAAIEELDYRAAAVTA
jgi:copper chaperone